MLPEKNSPNITRTYNFDVDNYHSNLDLRFTSKVNTTAIAKMRSRMKRMIKTIRHFW